MNLEHIIHLVIPPSDLYKPIILEKFNFKDVGYCKIFKLNPKYGDYYELGICFNNNTCFPSTYRFTGKLKILLYRNDKIIFEKDVTSIERGYFLKNDLNKYQKIVFADVKLPISKKDSRLEMKIILEKPDKILGKYNNLLLYIAVSGAP